MNLNASSSQDLTTASTGATSSVSRSSLLRLFRHWMAGAGSGERFVYHCGYLAIDRINGVSPLPEPERRELVVVADLAWALAEQGKLRLIQHRQEDGKYSYLAVARRRRRA